MLAITNGGTGMTAVKERVPRWVVVMVDPPYVFLAQDQNGGWPDRKAPSVLNTYFVRAQDELEAFMKARKMEAEDK